MKNYIYIVLISAFISAQGFANGLADSLNSRLAFLQKQTNETGIDNIARRAASILEEIETKIKELNGKVLAPRRTELDEAASALTDNASLFFSAFKNQVSGKRSNLEIEKTLEEILADLAKAQASLPESYFSAERKEALELLKKAIDYLTISVRQIKNRIK